MRYTIFGNPGCIRCREKAEELRAAGHEVEVLDETSLANLPDVQRRNDLFAQIHMSGLDHLPVVFLDDRILDDRTEGW